MNSDRFPVALLTSAAITGLIAASAIAPNVAHAAPKKGQIKEFNVGHHGYSKPNSARPVVRMVRHPGKNWKSAGKRSDILIDGWIKGGVGTKILKVVAKINGAPAAYTTTLYDARGKSGRKLRMTKVAIAGHASHMGLTTKVMAQKCATMTTTATKRSFFISVPVTFKITHRRTTTGTTQFTRFIKVKLECVQILAPKPNPQRTKPEFRVKSAGLLITLDNKNTCPRQVTLQIISRATAEGKANYKVIRSDGKVVMRGRLTYKRRDGGYKATFLKTDLVRRNHDYKYRVIVDSKGQPRSVWRRLHVQCAKPTKGKLKM